MLTPDEVKDLYMDTLPEVKPSMEMDDRMKEVLERCLGTGPWQDLVGSTLAKPLNAALVYTDEVAGVIPLPPPAAPPIAPETSR